ncbi:MAG: prepilin peptidase [Lachnospiraceae bacterium]|nr:prepilin peptidase [Lachnospiraceae bacterium]
MVETSIKIALYVFAFVFGTVLFSFLNVVIYRLPRKENFITGRSKCPACGHVLSFLDMLPILSWVVLGRKCRYCGAKISARYAIVEALGGLAAVSSVAMFGLSVYAALVFAMCAVLTCVGFIDHDTMEIPDGLSLTAAILGTVAVFFTKGVAWYEHLIGLAVISVPMLILALLIPGGFGGGDIKLMAGCGLFLGWKNALFSFFVAAVIGGVYAVILILRKKRGRKDHIPFGPFLCMGVAAAIFAGDLVLDFYIGRLLGL